MLQFPIQGQASLFSVIAQQGGESVHVAGGGARTNLVTEVGRNMEREQITSLNV